MPVDTPYLSVIVPAYNEGKSIGRTMAAMRAYLDRQPYTYEVIVAADGTDDTRDIVAALAKADPRVRLIGGPERGGKGKAVRGGVQVARGEVIGFLDADYKTPVDELDKVLPLLDGGADVVIGSRRAAGTQIVRRQPLYRRAGSVAFKGVLRMLIGLHDITDTQCGFKFFTAAAARTIFARQRVDGYMFDVEVLRLARELGYGIRQVGVVWQDDGDTRYNPVTGTWRNARELLRIRFGTRRAVVSPTPETAPAASLPTGTKVQGG